MIALAHLRRNALAELARRADGHAFVAGQILAVAVAAVLDGARLRQRMRPIDHAEFDLVLGAARRKRQAPGLLALLVRNALAGRHLDDVAVCDVCQWTVQLDMERELCGIICGDTYSSTFLHTFGPSSSTLSTLSWACTWLESIAIAISSTAALPNSAGMCKRDCGMLICFCILNCAA